MKLFNVKLRYKQIFKNMSNRKMNKKLLSNVAYKEDHLNGSLDRSLSALIHKQKRLFFVCSQWDPSLDNMRTILKKPPMKTSSYVDTLVLPSCNHELLESEAQKQLINAVANWANVVCDENADVKIDLRKNTICKPYRAFGFIKNLKS